MAFKKFILDTCVLYAGLYSSAGASYRVLREIERGRVGIYISTPLLFEYEDVLKRKKAELSLSDSDIDALLDNLCRIGTHQRIYYLWRPFLTDRKDDHILEIAITSRAHLIVTHNIRDFTGVDELGVRVIAPQKLLEEK